MTNDTKPTLREIALMASQRVGGLQGRALDRVAKKRGLTLSYTTVDKIIAGTYNSKPKRQTLEALAELAGVPIDQVYEAAGVPAPGLSLADQLPPDTDLLDPSQRRVVIDLLRVFTRQNREMYELREGVGNHASHPEVGDPEIDAIRASSRPVAEQDDVIAAILKRRTDNDRGRA